MMTIKEASKMAGVSVRTLQYYDAIGLLKPAKYTDSGYRLYDDATMEKLQQILLFKELEFSLEEIKEIISSPNFDKKKAVEQQIEFLIIKKERLENLISFARGIKLGGNKMDFKAFKEGKTDERTQKAKKMLQTFLNWTDEEKVRYNEEITNLFQNFGQIRNTNPDSQQAQNLVKQLQDCFSKYYGTEYTNESLYQYGCQLTAKDLYDEYEKIFGEGTMDFIYKAIKIYCGK